MLDTKLKRFAVFALLVLVDTALFNAAFGAAYFLPRFLGYAPDFETYLAVAHYTCFLPPLAFYFSGMYRTWDEYVFSKGMDAILSGVLGALVLLLGVIWLLRDQLASIEQLEQQQHVEQVGQMVWGFPTSVLVAVAVIAPMLLWVWRMIANDIENRLLGWSAHPRNALIVGSMDVSDLQRLMQSRRPRYRVLGRLCRDATDESSVFCLGTPEQLSEVVRDEPVDEVFLMASDFERAELLSAIRTCYENGVRPRLVMGIYETLLAATTNRLHGDMPLYSFRTGGISGWIYVIKRIMDVVLSAMALAIAGPFLVFPACIAIVIDSKGWPVFTQTRVGLHGRHFLLFKLRTMVVDAGAKGGPLTEDNDPRITRVGRFLRKTSIDEMPQLWNVLTGDMSLVGPRAVVPFVADQFQEWERLSLMVRPGVTGLAQVSGRDEIGFREKSLLNLYYVRNHSVWLDLRIMFDTVGVVVTMEGTEGTRGTP